MKKGQIPWTLEHQQNLSDRWVKMNILSLIDSGALYITKLKELLHILRVFK